MPQPPGPPEAFIFPGNFNDFHSHTKIYPRLKFCDPALCLSPLDRQKASFSQRNFNDLLEATPHGFLIQRLAPDLQACDLVRYPSSEPGAEDDAPEDEAESRRR